jgi:hypothetical protein
MTKRAAEEYLVSLRPKPVFEPSIRRRPTTSEPSPRTPPEPPTQKTEATKSESPALPPPPPPILEPATPEQFNFRFTAGKEFKEKLERLAEVLGIENAPKHIAEILDQALETALDKKDPKRKLERRREREAKTAVSSREDETRPDEERASEEKATSRYLSSEVRERVHERAGYRCQYRGPDGTRCSSRTGLEIEHERPFALQPQPRRAIPALVLPRAQPPGRGARVWRGVHGGQDRGLEESFRPATPDRFVMGCPSPEGLLREPSGPAPHR